MLDVGRPVGVEAAPAPPIWLLLGSRRSHFASAAVMARQRAAGLGEGDDAPGRLPLVAFTAVPGRLSGGRGAESDRRAREPRVRRCLPAAARGRVVKPVDDDNRERLATGPHKKQTGPGRSNTGAGLGLDRNRLNIINILIY